MPFPPFGKRPFWSDQGIIWTSFPHGSLTFKRPAHSERTSKTPDVGGHGGRWMHCLHCSLAGAWTPAGTLISLPGRGRVRTCRALACPLTQPSLSGTQDTSSPTASKGGWSRRVYWQRLLADTCRVRAMLCGRGPRPFHRGVRQHGGCCLVLHVSMQAQCSLPLGPGRTGNGPGNLILSVGKAFSLFCWREWAKGNSTVHPGHCRPTCWLERWFTMR